MIIIAKPINRTIEILKLFGNMNKFAKKRKYKTIKIKIYEVIIEFRKITSLLNIFTNNL